MYNIALNNYLPAAFWFALACTTRYNDFSCITYIQRGNGIVYCGFFVFNTLTSFSPFLPGNRTWTWSNFFTKWFVTAVCCVITVLPFLMFQYYGYTLYCTDPARHHISPWCTQRFPNMYNYVQSHYW